MEAGFAHFDGAVAEGDEVVSGEVVVAHDFFEDDFFGFDFDVADGAEDAAIEEMGVFHGVGFGNHNVNNATGQAVPFADYTANYSSTGGIGAAMTPRRFLKAGDRVRIEIEGLGALDNPCADEV